MKMLTATEKQLLRENLYEYEGKVEHMYQDTKGYITVGVGHLVKDLSAAQKINFIHQTTGEKATEDEIKIDFESVKKSPAGLFASLYKKNTKLKLATLTIEQLTDSHIDSFEKELHQIYGAEEFMSFPTDVKLALFDMIFNLGMTKLRNGFPNFNRCVKAKDWLSASNECNRLDIADARNKYVKDLFSKAA
jgi:GH24 family phage-related lysozyme (muramidase)